MLFDIEIVTPDTKCGGCQKPLRREQSTNAVLRARVKQSRDNHRKPRSSPKQNSRKMGHCNPRKLLDSSLHLDRTKTLNLIAIVPGPLRARHEQTRPKPGDGQGICEAEAALPSFRKSLLRCGRTPNVRAAGTRAVLRSGSSSGPACAKNQSNGSFPRAQFSHEEQPGKEKA